MGEAQTMGEMIQKIGMDDKGLLDGFKRQEKGYKRTSDTVKKSGDAMQKANVKTGKSFDKLGGSAYDFGNQIFSSMTVMEAMKEGVAGTGEQIAQAIWNGMADFFAHEDLGNIAENLGDWGQQISDFLWPPIDKALSEYNWKDTGQWIYGRISEAISAGEWEKAGGILAGKISQGDFSTVDASLAAAIMNHDWKAAGDIIGVHAAEGDFSPVGNKMFNDLDATSSDPFVKALVSDLTGADWEQAGKDIMAMVSLGTREMTPEQQTTWQSQLQSMVDKGEWLNYGTMAQQLFTAGFIDATEKTSMQGSAMDALGLSEYGTEAVDWAWMGEQAKNDFGLGFTRGGASGTLGDIVANGIVESQAWNNLTAKIKDAFKEGFDAAWR